MSTRRELRYRITIIFTEGFTGTKGAVKPRSSLDVVRADDLRSVKSTDDKYNEIIILMV